MTTFRATFIEKVRRTPGVVSFRFRPERDPGFRPGQFCQLIFDEQDPRNRELNKYLSLSCAPDKPYIEVTKRLSDSAFSQRLTALEEGQSILIGGPMGTCTYEDGLRRIGFLIGGIGITPVISILEYIVQRGLDTDVCLLYSNRTMDDVAFKPELDAWSQAHAGIAVTYLAPDCPAERADCLNGLIDHDAIVRRMSDYRDRTIYVFGPPVMVKAMAELCRNEGASPEQIRTENFVGY